ncbi:MAG: hypothetical protein ABEK59_05200 [Halobacteria archaeon]
MSGLMGEIDVERQPPNRVPLVHFLVGLVFLVFGSVTAVFVGFSGRGMELVHVHSLLVGWICITIMGAVSQFVPVWSGRKLYSVNLAKTQLYLVAGALPGFLASLYLGFYTGLPVFGGLMVLGFWVFVYNIARTLGFPGDVTELHFVFTLFFLVVATSLGFYLAFRYVSGGFVVGLNRVNLFYGHATFGVFGVVFSVIIGAVYQLVEMFTQTDIGVAWRKVRVLEAVLFFVSVVLLGGGRMFGWVIMVKVGVVLVLISLFLVSLVVLRHIFLSGQGWNPLLRRYCSAAVLLVVWCVLSFFGIFEHSLFTHPLFTVVGDVGIAHILYIGVVSLVVMGSLYHIVPFLVWVDRYSSLLGLEEVPMVDDLYISKLSHVDFVLILGSCFLVYIGGVVDVEWVLLVGGVAFLVGSLVFSLNMFQVVFYHSGICEGFREMMDELHLSSR